MLNLARNRPDRWSSVGDGYFGFLTDDKPEGNNYCKVSLWETEPWCMVWLEKRFEIYTLVLLNIEDDRNGA